MNVSGVIFFPSRAKETKKQKKKNNNNNAWSQVTELQAQRSKTSSTARPRR